MQTRGFLGLKRYGFLCVTALLLTALFLDACRQVSVETRPVLDVAGPTLTPTPVRTLKPAQTLAESPKTPTSTVTRIAAQTPTATHTPTRYATSTPAATRSWFVAFPLLSCSTLLPGQDGLKPPRLL
jgi:hypothetical protein